MKNIMLFVVTLSTYFCIWSVLATPTSGQDALLRVAMLTVLCVPFRIGDNVFTAFGSAENEKGSVYGLWSPYQKAEKFAYNIFGGLYQKANEAAVVFFGFVLYQQSEEGASALILGCSLLQKAPDCFMFFGLVGVQIADDRAEVNFGLTLFQKVSGCSGRSFVVWSETEKEA